MPDASVHTTQLRRWVERIRAGDRSAGDEMLRAVHARLERLARKMLRRFPRVARWEESGDLVQNAVLRLLRALGEVEPTSVRDFFGLAAEQMRRELLDLVRHYQARRVTGPSSAALAEPAASAEDAAELAKWSAFHEAVERLPVRQREVVGLIYYHGWTQAEVAEHLGVSKRSVQRDWASAMVTLHGLLEGG
jgi:RNA polymerase sigma-70 factor (ECF subfamily)